MDIRHVVRVVQFMVPPSLSVWEQRKGRAGRDGRTALGILLVEPSVFQRVKRPKPKKPPSKRKRESDEDIDDTTDDDSDDSAQLYDHKKKVEEGMRSWIDAPECRRKVNDEYFGNPARIQGALSFVALPCDAYPIIDPTLPCCDNCLASKATGNPANMTSADKDLLAYIERVRACTKHSVPIQIEVSDNDDDVPELASGTTAPKKTTLLAPRRGEPLASCRQVLTQWRAKTWLAEYSMCAFDETALLEDKDLTVLASRARIQNLSDLKFNVPNWSFASKYGQEVLAILREVDDRYQAARDLEAAER